MELDDSPFSASPLRKLSVRMSLDEELLVESLDKAAQRANANLGKNTYLQLQDPFEQAENLRRRFPDTSSRPLLFGVPVSVKDCFDVTGSITTLGSRYYSETSRPAVTDSWVAGRLRQSGAVIMGKSHMQELAYGITGQNSWFGDCLQPTDPTLLTGGSSSGAAASVQEGSVLAAVGTDTGGSIRIPASLCGLAGYRSSLGRGSWGGAWHLASSFDTIGLIFRDLRDGPLLAAALFGIDPCPEPEGPQRIGIPPESFIVECESIVVRQFDKCRRSLVSLGNKCNEFETDFWQESFAIFSAIQASEASVLHRGRSANFEPAIRERLEWGARLAESEIAKFREQCHTFRSRIEHLFARFDYLLLPASPVSRLLSGVDYSEQRSRIMRCTTPISLAGLPALVVPGGLQVVARHNNDAQLLAFGFTLHRVTTEQTSE